MSSANLKVPWEHTYSYIPFCLLLSCVLTLSTMYNVQTQVNGAFHLVACCYNFRRESERDEGSRRTRLNITLIKNSRLWLFDWVFTAYLCKSLLWLFFPKSQITLLYICHKLAGNGMHQHCVYVFEFRWRSGWTHHSEETLVPSLHFSQHYRTKNTWQWRPSPSINAADRLMNRSEH